MNCCPFFAGGMGHPPYLLWGFTIFCVIVLVIIIKKLCAIARLLEKK
ncbi:MAG: hypothetical protein ISS45_01065 [Candidatus Omnitrophica bacterium]|nr:hypothetical protein [Candidatus Omnitrophota bacterium]